jgi:hypothetical protein
LDFNTSVAAPSPAALDLKPPQVQNPLETLAQMQEMRARGQQMQAVGMENQQRQMDLQDQQYMRSTLPQLLADPANHGADGQPDWDKVMQGMAGNVSPKTVFSLQQLMLGNQEKRATISKTLADSKEIGAKLQTQELDYFGSRAAGIAKDGYNPVAIEAMLIDAEHLNPDYAPHAAQIRAQIAADPANAQRVIDGMVAASKEATTNQTAATAANARAAAAQTGQQRETRESGQQDFQNAASALGANPPPTQQAYQQFVGQLPPAVAKRLLASVPVAGYDPAKSGAVIRKLGMNPDQQTITENAAAQLAETIKRDGEAQRNHLADESIRRLSESVAQGRLNQEVMVNGMKYGPGTQEFWVKQLQDNPDSIKEMPAELRSSVGQKFKAATGLPLPTALSSTTQASETAARNALDGITFIQQAMQNPEIRKNLGPIMGRLGNAEQAVGTAVGLSPQAEQLAQELRTRMRYFVFQEGKAVLGGRLPQKLMEALESSSASVKMDPDMLQGALNGASGNAQSVMDNADKQRFGGQMRSRAMRGQGPAVPAAAPAVGTVSKGYRFKGGDPSQQANWEKVQQ